jgi:hypothetical protein
VLGTLLIVYSGAMSLVRIRSVLFAFYEILIFWYNRALFNICKYVQRMVIHLTNWRTCFLRMAVLTVMVAWPRDCTRNISQTDAILTIKHLPSLIVDSERESRPATCYGAAFPDVPDHIDRGTDVSKRQVVERVTFFAHDHFEGPARTVALPLPFTTITGSHG